VGPPLPFFHSFSDVRGGGGVLSERGESEKFDFDFDQIIILSFFFKKKRILYPLRLNLKTNCQLKSIECYMFPSSDYFYAKKIQTRKNNFRMIIGFIVVVWIKRRNAGDSDANSRAMASLKALERDLMRERVGAGLRRT
jgi:hypothetical protein